MDRGINPHDGSRRRLKSEELKNIRDYNRQKNKKIIITETFEEEDVLTYRNKNKKKLNS